MLLPIYSDSFRNRFKCSLNVLSDKPIAGLPMLKALALYLVLNKSIKPFALLSFSKGFSEKISAKMAFDKS